MADATPSTAALQRETHTIPIVFVRVSDPVGQGFVADMAHRRFISLTYRFFALTILAFGAALHFATPEQTVWVGRFFFIWTSVFNLFVVSIFWAMVVDIFTSDQGKRLFGFIAAGATLGAIVVQR
jgi:ATP:ADP antiporter, AAA family